MALIFLSHDMQRKEGCQTDPHMLPCGISKICGNGEPSSLPPSFFLKYKHHRSEDRHSVPKGNLKESRSAMQRGMKKVEQWFPRVVED